MQERTGSLVLSVTVAALSLWGVLWLVPAHTGDARTANDIPPALVPSVALALCLLLALLILARTLAGKPAMRPGPGSAPDPGAEPAPPGPRELLGDIVTWSAASAATFVALGHLGFIVTGMLVIAGWMTYCRVRSPVRIVATSVAVPVIIDRLSWYALTVPLP